MQFHVKYREHFILSEFGCYINSYSIIVIIYYHNIQNNPGR